MRRRRALISAQPWWQNSSYSRGASGSAPTANLVTTGKGAIGQQYTTIILTRTQYTTFIYSNSYTSRSQRLSRSILPFMGESSSKTTSHAILKSSSSSPLITYQPTTFSTTTTARVTTHSTTTVKTTVYITSTRTVPAASSTPQRVSTSAVQNTTSTTSTSATSPSASVAAGQGGEGRGSLLISPNGSSEHSAVIAGGMSGSLAGIALIGLLFLLFFRRKKRLSYQDKDGAAAEPRMSSSSQALPSAVAAAGAIRHSDRSAIMARQGSNPERLPVIDHNLIHMDLNHWDRPFAHEDPHLRDDGSPLRLMNPDPTPTPPVNLRTSSTSISPDAGPNNPHGFLQRQRSALTAALLSIKRSFSSQDVVPRHASYESQLQPSAHPSAHPSPLHIPDKNTNKLTMPSEAILAGVSASRPISSQSAMSNNTIIRHQVPDDPFVTSTSALPSSPLPNCLHPGSGVARRDFLAPPPLWTKMPMQSTPTHPRRGTVSPLTRTNSDCSTRFESLSPTRSEVSSVSFRSGPFDLATASVVDGESGREADVGREQREQTPNWEVYMSRHLEG
ncbi:uncharacterized protein M437DRAFT_56777 [Aureobasidium melanogenum CBS 110374]|uniref:Uncharacterized protein n=1 Tax=Aureobasidium melanogenum (strain CBS 110374) TaxID=1043003 RepID=A0A074WA93_AURM1|nr:uncharacterized protein M437DRAFT_56777 [Aureobasidium melanogenum CBS 110374]KEQ59441.1 hypothetical protein M437DRAFT_56777 [Aureobasidium melanogenum CBS 110374]